MDFWKDNPESSHFSALSPAMLTPAPCLHSNFQIAILMGNDRYTVRRIFKKLLRMVFIKTHLLNKCLLSIFYDPGLVLGTGDALVNYILNTCVHGPRGPWRETKTKNEQTALSIISDIFSGKKKRQGKGRESNKAKTYPSWGIQGLQKIRFMECSLHVRLYSKCIIFINTFTNHGNPVIQAVIITPRFADEKT